MQSEFWLERWQRNEIGFHQAEINTHLQQFWPELSLAPSSRVFVPLCGKSRDMLWLRAQGHQVLGVELSPLAVRDFFNENDLKPQVTSMAAGERWSCDGIEIVCGDFFALSASKLQSIAAVYDRASLVALPPVMREAYARHLCAILPPSAAMLLVTMDYDQAQMDGPPFAVSEAEVRSLYEKRYDVRRMHVIDVLAENPKFRERGLAALHEVVYHLVPR